MSYLGKIDHLGVHVFLCDTYTAKEKRTLKERLFSLPWRPFVKFKEVIKPVLEDDQVLGIPEKHAIMVNRTTLEKIKANIDLEKIKSDIGEDGESCS